MSEGWIALHRGWRDSPIFRGEFSRADAWVWLIEQAAWKPARIRIKGETIELRRGELSFAQRFLAEKWGWSKSRVDRFISELRDENMIETRSKNGASADHAAGQGQCIISICNYSKYQDVQDKARGNDVADNGATAGQQRGKEEQVNQITNEEREPNGSLSARVETDEVFDAWDRLAATTGNPRCNKRSVKRRNACRARIRDDGLPAILQAIQRIPGSTFLLGQTGSWAGATIDFILKPDSVTSILEGKYDDRPKQPGPSGPRSFDGRDGVAKALDGRLGFAEPPGPLGRHDAIESGSDCSRPPLRLAAMR